MIDAGTKKAKCGADRDSSSSVCVSSIIGKPPMPEPTTTPMRSEFSSVTSRPLSCIAWIAGGDAVMDKGIHVARFLGRDVVFDVEALHFAGKTGRRSSSHRTS